MKFSTKFIFVVYLQFQLQGNLHSVSGDLLSSVLDHSLGLGSGANGDRSSNALNEPGLDLSVLKNLPNILLRKQSKVQNSERVTDQVKVDPPECIDTHFFYPFKPAYTFPDADKKKEIILANYCSWNLIGTEACVPSLSCPVFDMPGDCSSNYMLVRDGLYGEQKFCGKNGPLNVIAAEHLRDLFVVINSTSSTELSLECTVKCTHRGVGEPITETVRPIIEKKCMCGQKPSSDRIVNGYIGKKSEYPWLVAVVEANTRQPFCGASILNDRFILTAAHCFKGKYMDYRRVQLILQAEILDIMPNAGVQVEKPEPKTYPPDVLEELDRGNDTFRLNIEEIFIHPLYISETNDFDIALVRTVETIKIKSKAQTPICLPPLGSYSTTFAHKPAIVAGWGLPSAEAPGTSAQLMKLNVTVFSQKLCKEYYVHRINKRMMCAGYKEGGRDSCMGDSGGPLMVETSPKVWAQVGTVSWGEGCAVAENPGVYYRMTETGQWINQVSNLHRAVWCDVPPSLRLRH